MSGVVDIERCRERPDEGCPAVVIAESNDGERRVYYVKVRRGQAVTTIAGIARISRLASEGWGSYVETRLGRIALVPPSTAQLMEGFYERRTQVIYPKDLGLIVLLAELRPGAKVLEAGTGSGFLTTAAALAVCPEGRVFSFDIRNENLESSRRNLEMAGLADCVELRLGDVRNPETVNDLPQLDSALLDLPDPWDALEAISRRLKPGSPLVAFLPTFNQVEKLALKAGKCWIVEDAIETMARRVDIRRGATRPSQWIAGFTGYIVVLRKLICQG